MILLVSYTGIGALLGAVIVFLAAEGLPEGAIAGVILGGSLGLLVAIRKGAGGKAASIEYEAAGIHDDNLSTIARRNLGRDAHYDDFGRGAFNEKIELAGSANRARRKSRHSP